MLSDELIEIGEKANPRSNMDMGEKSVEMLELLKKYHFIKEQYDEKKIVNIVRFVCTELNKKGFHYFRPSVFLFEG